MELPPTQINQKVE